MALQVVLSAAPWREETPSSPHSHLVDTTPADHSVVRGLPVQPRVRGGSPQPPQPAPATGPSSRVAVCLRTTALLCLAPQPMASPLPISEGASGHPFLPLWVSGRAPACHADEGPASAGDRSRCAQRIQSGTRPIPFRVFCKFTSHPRATASPPQRAVPGGQMASCRLRTEGDSADDASW